MRRSLFNKPKLRLFGKGVAKPVVTIPPAGMLSPPRLLAIAAIIKDEARNLKEWISFHLAAGVEHIFLYDNGSSDDTPDILQSFIRAGQITLTAWPHFTSEQNTQCLAYAHAISAYRHLYRWIACIDVDEFLFPVEAASLVDVLKDYEDIPALAVYWINFGTSGHREYQERGVLDSYVMRQRIGDGPDGRTRTNYKSVVQAARIEGIISAHAFSSPLYPVLALDEERKPIVSEEYKPIACNRIRINHYFTKSQAEWDRKAVQASSRAPGHSVRERRERFLATVGPMDVEDRLILTVRDRLGRKPAG